MTRHFCEITHEEWECQYKQFVAVTEEDRDKHFLLFFRENGSCIGMSSLISGRSAAWIETNNYPERFDETILILKDGTFSDDGSGIFCDYTFINHLHALVK